MKGPSKAEKLKGLNLLDISSKLSKVSSHDRGVDLKQRIASLIAKKTSLPAGCIVKSGMTKNPKITVIIPSYNTSNYIDQCLDSVKVQTLNNIEIIVVDDSSSDDTATKALAHAYGDERITLVTLTKQSGSPGQARNIGMMLASAPYIAFVDSDDWIDATMLENLYDSAHENDSDICFLSGFINHFEGETKKRYYKKSQLNADGKLRGFHESFMLWDKLWKLEFLNQHGLEISHTSASEELLFIIKAYYLAKKSSVATGSYGYNYRRLNPSSITKNVRNSVYPSYEFEAWDQVNSWLASQPVSSTYRDIISLRKILSFHYAISIANEEHKKHFSAEVEKYLVGVINEDVNAIAHTLGYDAQINGLKEYFAFAQPKPLPSLKQKNILFGPDWSSSNPYQKLMYDSVCKIYNVYATGFSPTQLTSEYLLTKRPATEILHLHWLHPFYDPASSASARAFIEKIQVAKELGYTIVWTAHNLMPHETSDLNEENHLSVRVAVIEAADYILVHDVRAGYALSQKFSIPKDKLFIAPHGLYEQKLNYSEELKQHIKLVLDIEPARFTVLLAGRIRGYKGIERAVKIFTRGKLGLLKDATLIVAGYPDDEAIDSKVVEAANNFSDIKYIRGDISDVELEAIFMASDVCLLPYEKSATSGLAFLSISYQTPLITSKLPAFEGFVERGMAISASSDEDIEQAISFISKAHSGGNLKNLFSSVASGNIRDLTWDTIVRQPSIRQIFEN